MPNPNQQSTFGFVEETTDDVWRKTFQSEDEKQFAKEQARRRAPKVKTFPVPETGACCDRCRHFRRPTAEDAFGECGFLVITLVPYGSVEKGTILSARERPEIEADPLRCKPWAGQGCSAFTAISMEVAA